MENSNGASMHRDLLLPSKLESVDQAEEAVMAAARELGFDEDTQHDIGISVRESMVNAVAHGNRYHGRKQVRLQVWSEPDRLVIEIEDEGRGFEIDGVPDPREGENVLRQSGRGLLMIRAFMDEFEIGPREPNGTRVRMVKYARKEGG